MTSLPPSFRERRRDRDRLRPDWPGRVLAIIGAAAVVVAVVAFFPHDGRVTEAAPLASALRESIAVLPAHGAVRSETSAAEDLSDAAASSLGGSEPGMQAIRSGVASPQPDAEWVGRLSAATGIPPRALRAYAAAQLRTDIDDPGCGVGWNTIAAIGAVESGHGTHGGASVGVDGRVSPAILGPALDGDGVALIADTDGGALDGDTRWDRAVGPMQFIPETWQRVGIDADGDGVADPQDIDDAAAATARYLCAAGSMTDAVGWRRAVFSYNHLDAYVDDVAHQANTYAAARG
ncbi:MAG: lytic murein transglycosylase [Microbacterium sp.]|uniref:lytic transglycosylase domain-containing protein n=1 Tax=Microbacterium sp. TaxID=51671 RepID=UPI001AD28FC9|nr:lytic murein transglycosylase [Microbacterium sp.]MBN9177876.1 lytic murein transglycosylase [Microbacterium sp.]